MWNRDESTKVLCPPMTETQCLNYSRLAKHIDSQILSTFVEERASSRDAKEAPPLARKTHFQSSAWNTLHNRKMTVVVGNDRKESS